MKAVDSVRIIMERKGLRTVDMCNRLNIPSNAFCTRLTMKNISISKLDEMMRAMDYKIVIMPVEERTSQNAIRIE